MGRKRKIKSEVVCEDVCFNCKDGGSLVVCDYRNCHKAYHLGCVEKDVSLIENGERWTCAWHSCSVCHIKNGKFQCFCCPQAVCGRCIVDVEFAYVRGSKGFCKHCITLALLIDEDKDVNSDGVKVDFNDKETYEFLFKEYLVVIMSKESLTWKHIHCSASSMKAKKKLYKFDSNEIDEMEENIESEEEVVSDYDELEEPEEYKPHKRKNVSKKKSGMMIEKVKKSKRMEFIGWGSKPLFEFLASIGKETNKELSQYDVTTIITNYCIENKLFHAEKKKKIICDARLQSLLGRKSLSKNSIHNLLTAHFAENFDQSEEDESRNSSEHEDGGLLEVCKRQRKSSKCSEDQKTKVPKNSPKSCYASIVPENIKLVYLRRSVVEQLLKEPKMFDAKVVGSYVRVKSDPNDYLQRTSHQLLQVKGVNRVQNSEMDDEILLELSNLLKNVPVCKLSDDSFYEEECEDLHQKINSGLLKKPTVVELEEKAKSLHEDITKHWIAREITHLENQIERANEKGWRRELFEYMRRKQLLQSPSEQLRLLEELPQVIADVAELEPVSDDSLGKVKQGPDSLPESPVGLAFQTPDTNLGNENNSSLNDKTDSADGVAQEMDHHCSVPTPRGVKSQSGDFVELELSQESHLGANGFQTDLQGKHHQLVSGLKKSCLKSLSPEEVQQIPLVIAAESLSSVIPEKQHQLGSANGDWKNQSAGIKKKQVFEVESSKSTEFIELRDNDQDHEDMYEEQSRVIPEEQHQLGSDNGKCKNQPEGIPKKQAVEKESSRSIEFIELGDDDDQDQDHENVNEDPTQAAWYTLGPDDNVVMGPYSLSMLKRWCDMTSHERKHRVWMEGQSKDEAISVTDAIRLFGSDIGGKGQAQSNGIQKAEMKNKSSKTVESIIELSDDDEDCKSCK